MLPWMRGKRDDCGGAAGAAGVGATGRSFRKVLMGRLGESNWRLPTIGSSNRQVAGAPASRISTSGELLASRQAVVVPASQAGTPDPCGRPVAAEAQHTAAPLQLLVAADPVPVTAVPLARVTLPVCAGPEVDVVVAPAVLEFPSIHLPLANQNAAVPSVAADKGGVVLEGDRDSGP